METWKKIPYKRGNNEGVRYTRKTAAYSAPIIVRTDRVPEDVKRRLEHEDKVETSTVTKPCLFCDSQATMQRYCNMVMVDLCENHYYSKNIGKIAEQMRKEEERHGDDTKVSEVSKQKSKSKITTG